VLQLLLLVLRIPLVSLLLLLLLLQLLLPVVVVVEAVGRDILLPTAIARRKNGVCPAGHDCC
jgi:hypothetical protein